MNLLRTISTEERRMSCFGTRFLAACMLLASTNVTASATEGLAFSRTEDVIFGRKCGMALTMDVVMPLEHQKGLGVILVLSGGYFSDHQLYWVHFRTHVIELVGAGYTVFAVVHSSQPKFTIPEILQDLNRAVRFIRYHAKDYHIDPDHIGIIGASSGGHLSLMQGTAGTDGDPKAPDPVDRVSSRVQAVACFFAPTDFLNYGQEGADAMGTGPLARLKAPFEFQELDPRTHVFVRITDPEKRRAIGREISPIYHISSQSAPTLIIHGDRDRGVPIQQSELFIAALKRARVECKLVVKAGAGHDWQLDRMDMSAVTDWFGKHLGQGNR
jgi:acetyl esterase/lipase